MERMEPKLESGPRPKAEVLLPRAVDGETQETVAETRWFSRIGIERFGAGAREYLSTNAEFVGRIPPFARADPCGLSKPKHHECGLPQAFQRPETMKAVRKARPKKKASISRSLSRYHTKRDFKKTKEPSGSIGKENQSRFVIQKHDASRLHYDFRLEVDGTLKSWAVPKGIPYKKGEKHLAVQVEDHPVEYGGFEGVIPKGEYGGGTVMLWDRGHYSLLGGSPRKALSQGKLHFQLEGEKLHGEWTLVRLSRGNGDEWLLIKSDRDCRPVGKTRDNESSLSGRTMTQIARDKDAEWHSHKKSPRLAFVAPMKATIAANPPTQGTWLYELKFDGYRAIAVKNGSEVGLWSLNEKDFSKRFPEITAAIADLPVDHAIFDGEIVALDEEGRSSFQLLQTLESGDERPPLAYYIFDLLNHSGTDLRGTPLHERRAQLEKLTKQLEEPLRYSAEIPGDPKKLLAEIRARGLEGIIGKERDSIYHSGVRSRSWVKLKCVNEQEFVIGGYTPPEGTRKHFGALLVGYYKGSELQFAGKVGTGFNHALLKSLYNQMKTLHRNRCPFANLPEKAQGRWLQNITPAEMKHCHWIDPSLVCQLRFTEWTRDGKLRHPVFLGLREDKQAEKVVRERAAAQK